MLIWFNASQISSRSIRIDRATCLTSPKHLFGRDSLGFSGEANKLFLTFLCSNNVIGLQFLKDVGLIRSKVECNSCCRDMTCYADPSAIDGFRWRGRRMVVGTRCLGSRSIRHGAWFQRSELTVTALNLRKVSIFRLEKF